MTCVRYAVAYKQSRYGLTVSAQVCFFAQRVVVHVFVWLKDTFTVVLLLSFWWWWLLLLLLLLLPLLLPLLLLLLLLLLWLLLLR